jgi:hypothetical protein
MFTLEAEMIRRRKIFEPLRARSYRFRKRDDWDAREGSALRSEVIL